MACLKNDAARHEAEAIVFEAGVGELEFFGFGAVAEADDGEAAIGEPGLGVFGAGAEIGAIEVREGGDGALASVRSLMR